MTKSTQAILDDEKFFMATKNGMPISEPTSDEISAKYVAYARSGCDPIETSWSEMEELYGYKIVRVRIVLI